VIEALRSRLTENTHTPAPVSRTLVATEAGDMIFDQLVHRTPNIRWQRGARCPT
jgi:hypothetical protein